MMISPTLTSRRVALVPEVDIGGDTWVQVGRLYLRRDELVFGVLYWEGVEIPEGITGLTAEDDRVLDELKKAVEVIPSWSKEATYDLYKDRPAIYVRNEEVASLEERVGNRIADPAHLAAWLHDCLERLPRDGGLALLSTNLPTVAAGMPARRALEARLTGVLGVPTEATVRQVLDFKRARRDELHTLRQYLDELVVTISTTDAERDLHAAQLRLARAVTDYSKAMHESFGSRIDKKDLMRGTLVPSLATALAAGLEAAAIVFAAGGALRFLDTALSPRVSRNAPFSPVAYAFQARDALR